MDKYYIKIIENFDAVTMLNKRKLRRELKLSRLRVNFLKYVKSVSYNSKFVV